MNYIKLFEDFTESNKKVMSDLNISEFEEDRLDDFYKYVDIEKLLKEYEEVFEDFQSHDEVITSAYRAYREISRELEEDSNNSGKIELRRAVFLNDESDLNFKELGDFWTNWEIDEYLFSKLAENMGGIGDKKPYILTATFNKSDVNLISTIIARMMFVDEKEINMTGANPIKYSIEEFDETLL